MQIASLHTYPVKGCRRLDHDSAQVEPWGLAGDRRWMIVDEVDGQSVTQREVPGLAAIRPSIVDGVLRLRAAGAPDLEVPEPDAPPVPVAVHRSRLVATPAGPAADAWLTALLERKVRLVWLDDPTRRPVDEHYGEPGDRVSFADAYPVLLANAASLEALNGWLAEEGSPEGALPMARFRPNIVISGAAPWAEDGWLGRRLRIGGVTFRAVKPCDRCVVTTTDQETGERGHEPLRTLGKRRNIDQKLLFGTNLIPDGPGRIAVGDPVTVI
ncbi:MAG: MOSC domain-containing protein [Micromonosporaceae bacterium]|nr:MOSC domain-containing protein [Micromonosporaceae bacterium]